MKTKAFNPFFSVALSVFLPLWLGAQVTQPNIVFIITDDQRPDTISALGDFFAKNGNVDIETPHLDSLVQAGCTFMNARNMGASQQAICVASRSMIMSGQSLYRKDNQLTGRTTLGETLQSAGYYTFGTGKWHNGDASFRRTFTEAKNIGPGFLPNGHDVNYTLKHSLNGAAQANTNSNGQHSSNIYGQTAVDFINNYSGSSPFFAYVSFNGPHDPFDPNTDNGFNDRAPYQDASGNSTLSLPANYATDHPFNPGVLNTRDELLQRTESGNTLPVRPLNNDFVNEQNADYCAMITRIDYWVGQIVSTLQTKGLLDNTIIIFTSDHGLARGSHGLIGKQNLYEHSVEIPLIMRGPGVPANTKNHGLVYTHDLFTTVCDYAGSTLPTGHLVEGLSVRGMAEGTIEKVRNVAYHGYASVMRSVQQGSWKLIEYHVSGQRNSQLFDLEQDPLEMNNLSASATHADKLAEMRLLLYQQKTYYGDNNTTFWNNSGLIPGGSGVAGNAPITWQNSGTAQATTGAGDLITGNVVFARNGGGSQVTVNGIAFPAMSLGTGVLSTVHDVTTMQSTGNTDFDSLIDTLTYGGGGGTSDFQITGLVPGETYTMQVFFNDQRSSFAGRVMRYSDNHGNQIDVAAGNQPGSQANDYGQYAVGTFVAEQDNQVLKLTPLSFGNAHITAILVTGPSPMGTGSDEDSDADGVSDTDELLVGTNPYDPCSKLDVEMLDDGNYQMRWFGVHGRDYVVEVSTDLMNWDTAITGNAGQGRSMQHALPSNPSNERAFYRLRVQQN